MLSPLDSYYDQLPEPQKSCLLFLRQFLLDFSPDLSEHYKYHTAFFHFKGKGICYFSVRKKDAQTYIGFMDGYRMKHPDVVSEDRTQIKVYYINLAEDLDLETIAALLKEAIEVHGRKK